MRSESSTCRLSRTGARCPIAAGTHDVGWLTPLKLSASMDGEFRRTSGPDFATPWTGIGCIPNGL
ncbi:hypothetical protein ABTN21_19065, partial [Acinetobacter baumannii]